MNWPLIHTIVTIIFIVIILNLMPFIEMPLVNWTIGFFVLVLIIISLLPKLDKWLTHRKQDKIAARYFKKLKDLIHRFAILIDPIGEGAIPRLNKEILIEIDENSEVCYECYEYESLYNIFKTRLDSMEKYKLNTTNLRITIEEFSSMINVFLYFYMDRVYNYLVKQQTNVTKNQKTRYNSSVSIFERLCKEFTKLCKEAKENINNIPQCDDFVVREL